MSTAAKPRNRIILLLGILLAGLAFAGVLYTLRQNGDSGATATVQVVVAKGNVSAGTQLTSDQVTVASLPANQVPPGASSVPGQFIGGTTIAAISDRTPLTPSLVAVTNTAATTPADGSSAPAAPSLALQVTKGDVAFAIPAQGASADLTGDLMSVGNYIRPDDHIDIVVDPGDATAGIRFSFQDVRILRVGTAASGAGAAPSVFIVELPRNQAEQLIFLTTHRGPQTVVRYVLRPSSQNGTGPLDATGTPPKFGQDQTVTADTFAQLFS